jgi:GTPase SAR1 family protein
MGGMTSKWSKSNPVEERSVRKRVVSAANYSLKIRLVGEEGVGKSSLILRAADEDFQEGFIDTFGVDFKRVAIDFGEFEVSLQLWDTTRIFRMQDNSSFHRPFHGMVAVLDLSERDTWEAIPVWLTEMKRYKSPETVLVIVGTKKDLPRVVPRKEIQTFVDCDEQLLYFEISAKTGEGVEYFINRLALKMVEANNERTISSHDLSKFLTTAWMTKRKDQDYFSVFLLLTSDNRKSQNKSSLCACPKEIRTLIFEFYLQLDVSV